MITILGIINIFIGRDKVVIPRQNPRDIKMKEEYNFGGKRLNGEGEGKLFEYSNNLLQRREGKY
jgi:hypothetical protein